MKLQDIIKIKLDLSNAKFGAAPDKYIEPNPCGEPGYVAYGTKMLDGKEVPNCIPDPEQMNKVKKEGFPVPSPNADEDENTFISRCNSELYDEYPDDAQRNAICYSKWRGE